LLQLGGERWVDDDVDVGDVVGSRWCEIVVVVVVSVVIGFILGVHMLFAIVVDDLMMLFVVS
jgi:hypothetical protein